MTLLNDTIKFESPNSENSQFNNMKNKGKEEKEALLRQFEVKTMILNELKIEYLELKEKMKINEIEMSNLALKNNKDFYFKDEYLSI